MAAGRLLLPSWMPALDGDGVPIPNAKVFFYVNLTTTLAPVYADEALTTPLANPIEANASGRFPAVWADGDALYSASVEAPYGPAGVPFTYDNLSASLGADILIAGAAETAADEAIAALAAIEEIAANAPDAPSVVNKANRNFDNVTASDYSSKAFPIPLGGGNQAPVPVDIKTRWSNYASFEDFGISVFESDGVTVKDNTVALQNAIDKLQAVGGVLFAPPTNDREATTVVSGPLTLREGTISGVNYDGASFAIVGIGQGDRTSFQNGRFDLGQGIKLKAGAAGALITSPAKAGHLIIENMLLNGNDQPHRVIDLQDRDLVTQGYGFGAHLSQVYITAPGKAGLYAGSARGRGSTNWLWIEGCGAVGGEAALVQNAFDWEHYSIGLGVNDGPSLYLGAVSQVRFFGGALWQSGGAIISSDCDNVDFIGVHFDEHREYALDVAAYTGSATRRGTRRFIDCRFSDNAHSVPSGSNFADILLRSNVDDCYFAATAFEGVATGSPKNIYCVETQSGATFYADSFPFDAGAKKPYATAFTNDWSRVRFGGTESATWGIGNSGSSLIARTGGGVGAEFRSNDASIGGVFGDAPLRASKIGTTAYNRILVQSTDSSFDFVQIVADSTAANCDMVLSPKGTGVLRFGAYTASAITADGYIRIKLADGSFARILVDKE